MENRPLRRPAERALIHAEDIDSAIEQILAAASKISTDYSTDAKGVPLGEAPDISEYVRAGLRDILEDELVPAVVTSDGEIDVNEVRHEVIKKALVGLKMPVLRDIARGRGLPTSGKGDDLATRVAAAYNWNEEEIARLVLDNESEPADTERGFQTRIFMFHREPDLANILQRLSYVTGRYIRTGIARWFVFEHSAEEAKTVELRGSYRSYNARVDEDIEGLPELTSKPSRAATRLEVSARRSFLVHDSGTTAARSSASALQLATEWQVLDFVPLRQADGRTVATVLHPASEFMLDLLYTRFRHTSFEDPNLNLARFRVNDREDEVADKALPRPSLRAVRFEGEHLLDSVSACRLLATDRRPLVDVTMTVSVKSKPDRIIRGRFPVRVALEADHVLVSTGFGTGEFQLSLDVHREVVEAVRDELELGIGDEERLKVVIGRILERATMQESPNHADILFDPAD